MGLYGQTAPRNGFQRWWGNGKPFAGKLASSSLLSVFSGKKKAEIMYIVREWWKKEKGLVRSSPEDGDVWRNERIASRERGRWDKDSCHSCPPLCPLSSQRHPERNNRGGWDWGLRSQWSVEPTWAGFGPLHSSQPGGRSALVGKLFDTLSSIVPLFPFTGPKWIIGETQPGNFISKSYLHFESLNIKKTI